MNGFEILQTLNTYVVSKHICTFICVAFFKKRYNPSICNNTRRVKRRARCRQAVYPSIPKNCVLLFTYFYFCPTLSFVLHTLLTLKITVTQYGSIAKLWVLGTRCLKRKRKRQKTFKYIYETVGSSFFCRTLRC